MIYIIYLTSDPAQLVSDQEDGPSAAQRPRLQATPGGEQ